jgi:hypothetical protein
MDRRAYLTAVGSGLALFAGCSDSAGEEQTGTATRTATETPTATPEPTPESTPTPEPEPTPTVTDAGLLANQGEYSELDSDIDGVGQGGTLFVGTEFEMPVSNGSVSGFVEVTVYDSTDSEVATNSVDIGATAEDRQRQSRQAWLSFETESWALGEYTAEVVINSDDYGTTSTARSVAFDVVEPLDEGEVEIERADPSDQIFVDEDVTIEFTVTNVSDRDSSLLTDFPTIEYETGESAELDVIYIENLPAGESETVRTTEISFNVAGTYTFRLSEQDAEFTFTVEEN